MQIVASATMSASMISSVHAFFRGTPDIEIVEPLGVQGAGSDLTDGSSFGASVKPKKLSLTWGWGESVRGIGGPTGRGTAGGINTKGAVTGSLPPALVHCYATEEKRHHVDMVRRLIHALNTQRVLVFMNHQARLKDAMQKLVSRGLSAGVLHGDMPKQRRQAVLEQFRIGKFRALLVSDVVARGLDVPDCDAVIHLELPTNAAHYAHRAGRTGRMGRPGVVVCVVEKSQVFVVERLSSQLGVPLHPCKVQGGLATIIESEGIRVLGQHNAQQHDQALGAAQEAERGLQRRGEPAAPLSKKHDQKLQAARW
jgi:superfamily II DNA/RNA helicase